MKARIFAATFWSIITLAGCGSPPRQTNILARTTVPVTALTVSETEMPAVYTVSGTVRAKTVSSLSSRVLGYVRSVSVREGDRVEAGQVLITLDSEDLDARYKQAESARQEMVSALPEAESALSQAKANLDLAEVTFQRMQDLYTKRSISNQEFDEATAKVKAARAGYEMASARRAQTQSRIAQTGAELHGAAIQQSYSRIVAPFSGVVITKNVEPGVLAVPGASLLTLEREGAYRFEAPVEESRLPSIHLGQKSLVLLDALDCRLNGRVSEIAPVVDANSRSYLVKIDLPAAPNLRSGLFGRASFEGPPQKVLAIPRGAISQSGQLESVLVVEQGIAGRRLITAGQSWNGQTEVLSGLHPGDKVIYPVPAGLREGTPVEARPAPEGRP